jgi:hypothetical protein
MHSYVFFIKNEFDKLKFKELEKKPKTQLINLIILSKALQNMYQTDSIMDDSMSGSQNHSPKLSKEANKTKLISNR